MHPAGEDRHGSRLHLEARAARFQTLLTDMAAEFAQRPTDRLHGAIREALQHVAAFLGAGMAVLCEVSDEGHVSLTHWWVDAATGSVSPPEREVDATPIRDLLRHLTANAPVVIRRRDELPENSAAQQWLAERRVQSLAMVPTQPFDHTLTVLAVVGGPDHMVDWPQDTVPCMRLAAALFAGVLARARAEAQQQAVERRMQESQKLESLGVLAGGIAHDFNNLLTAILGHASLLRAEFNDVDGLAVSLEAIEAAARRAAELCRQMLAFAGRGRVALHVVDLNEVIRGMAALLQVTVPKKCTLHLALAPSLPPVLADEAQLGQLLMNLVINAAEALHDGTGTIAVGTAIERRSARDAAETTLGTPLTDGEYVVLRVSDTGAGMAPETIARIFDPFFTTKFTGRGMGLAAAAGIVRAHGGALRVTSAPGAGSTFALLLPAYHGSEAPPPGEMSPDTNVTAAAWRTTGVALVVDDEAGVRDLVKAVLERAGMTVLTAHDGARGVEMFCRLSAQVRLLLVDMIMPGLDGREALAAMRKVRADVPAIVMSGYSPADVDLGSARAFLQKPFAAAALRTTVKRVLEP